MNSEQLIATYINIRDQKAALKAKQAAEMKPFDEALAKLESQMIDILDASGAESMKTASGTAYKLVRTSVTVADKSAFMDFIKEHGAFDMLDVRANKSAVEEYLHEQQDLPPGVNVRRDMTVGFRRA
jgi:hypothetical protein